MKMIGLLAAMAVAATAMPAMAQTTHTTVRTTTVQHSSGYRGIQRRGHRVCTTRWRHHRQVRECTRR